RARSVASWRISGRAMGGGAGSRSRMRTRWPRRPRARARTAPPIPPPTISASVLMQRSRWSRCDLLGDVELVDDRPEAGYGLGASQTSQHGEAAGLVAIQQAKRADALRFREPVVDSPDFFLDQSVELRVADRSVGKLGVPCGDRVAVDRQDRDHER